jgi:hypothetical protein
MYRTKRRLTPVLIIAVCITLVTLALYLGGYFAASYVIVEVDHRERYFYHHCLRTAYGPLARIEATLTGMPVVGCGQHGEIYFIALADGSMRRPRE